MRRDGEEASTARKYSNCTGERAYFYGPWRRRVQRPGRLSASTIVVPDLSENGSGHVTPVVHDRSVADVPDAFGEEEHSALHHAANWHLSWSYWGCPAGTPSNFIVTEYNVDGSLDPYGVSVNELGTRRGPVATYAYGDAGTHYFQVTSECNWSLVPVTG